MMTLMDFKLPSRQDSWWRHSGGLLLVVTMIGFVFAAIGPDRASATTYFSDQSTVTSLGTTIGISLTGPLHSDHPSGSTVNSADFALTVGGIAVNSTSFSVEVAGQTQLTLTLLNNRLIYQNQRVTLTYTQPGTGRLKKTDGTPLSSFSQSTSRGPGELPLYNNSILQSPDTTPPELASGTTPSLASNGTDLILTFDEELSVVVPDVIAFTVEVTEPTMSVSVLSVTNSGTTSVLTLSPAVSRDATVKVSYTKPSSDGLRDGVDNLVATFALQDVTNNSTVSPSSNSPVVTPTPDTSTETPPTTTEMPVSDQSQGVQSELVLPVTGLKPSLMPMLVLVVIGTLLVFVTRQRRKFAR